MDILAIERAAKRIRDVIHQIPLAHSHTFSAMSGAAISLKCENLQKTGSFKVRGAYNKIARLVEEGERPDAIIASSAGNHAQGVAYAGQCLGIPTTIVMPQSAPIAKIAATEGYGARVVLHGESYDDAFAKANEIQQQSGAVFIHPFDDDDVIAGQGTLALEILSELPTVDVVLIPAGGGGLLSGMAACIKQINPRVRVIGVQAEGADAIAQSFAAKQRIVTDSVHTIADGIAVKAPGARTLELIGRYVDDVVTVPDSAIAAAIVLLLERTKQVVEPSGAAALAAALNHMTEIAGKRVVCVLSGGNIDVSFIHRIVEKGLIDRGRQMQLRTIAKDSPGSLARVCQIVGQCGANIIAVQHDRLRPDLRLDEIAIYVGVEVGGFEHGKQVVNALSKAGYQVSVENAVMNREGLSSVR